jgi:hypothetical protein
MASIKHLKKFLKAATEDLKDECLISLVIHPDLEPSVIAGIIKEIDDIGTELLFRVNHCNYKPAEMTAKQYVNVSLAEAENKMKILLEKMRDTVK